MSLAVKFKFLQYSASSIQSQHTRDNNPDNNSEKTND